MSPVSGDAVRKISSRTKAIIPVHLYGQMVDMEAVRAFADTHELYLLEDAAHCIEGSRNGIKPGQLGDAACFSFYANKNLSTGEGGAIALFDDETANRLRSLRQNGMALNAWKRFNQPTVVTPSELEVLGYKMNYTDLQASIGRVQLKRQAGFYERRLEIASLYYRELKEFKGLIFFQEKILHPGHARHLFVIRLGKNR